MQRLKDYYRRNFKEYFDFEVMWADWLNCMLLCVLLTTQHCGCLGTVSLVYASVLPPWFHLASGSPIPPITSHHGAQGSLLLLFFACMTSCSSAFNTSLLVLSMPAAMVSQTPLLFDRSS